MSKLKSKRRLLPPWNMPSDPVMAVWWFLHWLLIVLVRFFWVPILIMVLYEAISNGVGYGVGDAIVSGLITLVVGLVVWGLLSGLLFTVNAMTNVSRVVSDINRFQQAALYQQQEDPFVRRNSGAKVVEGTIINLEDKRKERK